MTAVPNEVAPQVSTLPTFEPLIPLMPQGVEKGEIWQDATLASWTRLEGEHMSRRRYEGSIHFNNKVKYVRITEPLSATLAGEVPSDEVITVYHFLGFTEMVDAGTAPQLHNALAVENPDKRIVSIATDGIGKNVPRQSLADSLFETFDDVAKSDAQFMRMLSGTDPVELVATSMGNHVMYRIVRNALQGKGDWLDIRHITFNIPALVARENVLKDMVIKFCVQHVGANIVRESARHPWRAAHYAADLLRSFRPSQLPSYVGNAANLLKGMRWEDIGHILDMYDSKLLGGGHDPLLQLDRWQAVAPQGLTRYEVHIDRKAGHCAVMNTFRTVAALSSQRASEVISLSPSGH